MKVHELIEALQKLNPYFEVELDGPDATCICESVVALTDNDGYTCGVLLTGDCE